jgi:(S)-2-hydroxy-acid oxidase
LSTTVFGNTIAAPIGLTCASGHNRFHPNGERETARGAKLFNTIFVLSAGSSVLMEDIAQQEPGLVKWFQIIMDKNKDIIKDLIKRAEGSGFKAIVLTIDNNGLSTLKYYINKTGYKILTKSDYRNLDKYEEIRVAISTWDDVKWIKAYTSLPLILKGVLTAEDAKLAIEYGVNGIWVSNHGGRQLDGTPTSVELFQ